MIRLSVLIPARNEQFLAHTVRDLLRNIRADTEILVALDGAPALEPLPEDSRVRVLEFSESIGQRAATNALARIAHGEYVMKVDAHCAFDEGFDAKLLADAEPQNTYVPIMKNLHVFDLVCARGHRRYQSCSGPCEDVSEWLRERMQTQKYSEQSLAERLTDDERKTKREAIALWLSGMSTPNAFERGRLDEVLGKGRPIELCGLPTVQDVLWKPKRSPNSKSYCFDPEPHFRYFRSFNKRPEGIGHITESMSLQGSCWMLSQERYHALNVCDESLGSWGSQGIEVACKTWLSGGRVLVNHDTWYAHLFRTQGADFDHPFPISGQQVDTAKRGVRELFFEGKWPQMVRPLSWLIERFWPIENYWTQEDIRRLQRTESSGTPVTLITV